MRVAIIGIGAVGGWIAGALAAAGKDPLLVARGETLRILRTKGLTVTRGGVTRSLPVRATDDPRREPPADLLILATKAYALTDAAEHVRPLIGAGTAIMPLTNGVPWWFMTDTPLRSVDPDGRLAAALPLEQLVGAVVHAAAFSPSPGHVRVDKEDRLILGPASAASAPMVPAVHASLAETSLPLVVSTNIRRDIWFKLWGNMTMNPISALTRATADRILDDPLVARHALAIMDEAAAIGDRIGCPVDESGAARQAVTRKLGAFRTSMLQDAEAGRPLEIVALLEAPREIAARVGVATPNLDALAGLARLLDGSIHLRNTSS